MPQNLIPVGKLVKPVGLTGRFKVQIYTKGSESLKGVKKIYLKGPQAKSNAFLLLELALKPGSATVKVAGIETMEEVLDFKNFEVCIDADDLPKLEGGEYYHYQLIGMEVFTVSGELIGKLENIFSTKSNDIYCIRGRGKEHLIPAVKNIVKEIDTKKRRIVIEPTQGLLDD